MSQTPSGTNTKLPDVKPQPQGRRGLLKRHPWITFVLPLLVFMLVGSLEPTKPQEPSGEQSAQTSTGDPNTSDGGSILPQIPYRYYPLVYTLKIAMTIVAILFVLPGYREFPLRVSPLAVVVGVIGVVVWVGLCRLNVEHVLGELLASLLRPIKLDGLVNLGTRSAFNPLQELAAHPGWAWGFLAIRFVGLVAVASVIEEFFLRGFLMRFVVANHWWEVPMGTVSTAAIVVAVLVPMAVHPAEWVAAAVWFSMVTLMFVKTRNIWDCVIAHAVTNLLLGVYVVCTGEWQLM
jgi:membrane protease YdiL (CAAX protease family)